MRGKFCYFTGFSGFLKLLCGNYKLQLVTKNQTL